MASTNQKKIKLDDVFIAISEPLKSVLSSTSATVSHPGTKGDASEYQWLKWLKTYLPKRYEVNKGFVIDSCSSISDQQDIIIYDRQYSPYLLSREGVTYVPAESVYGVIEVKQTLNKKYLKYTCEKIQTVRELKRTSVSFGWAQGKMKPSKPKDIIGGFVCLTSDWKNGIKNFRLEKTLKEFNAKNERIDIGCCLESGSFEVNYSHKNNIDVKKSTTECSLVYFFLRLLTRLQKIGTVPAINYESYAKQLSSFSEKKEASQTKLV